MAAVYTFSVQGSEITGMLVSTDNAWVSAELVSELELLVAIAVVVNAYSGQGLE